MGFTVGLTHYVLVLLVLSCAVHRISVETIQEDVVKWKQKMDEFREQLKLGDLPDDLQKQIQGFLSVRVHNVIWYIGAFHFQASYIRSISLSSILYTGRE